MIAVRVGVAGGVEPTDGQVFAIGGAGQQSIDGLLVGGVKVVARRSFFERAAFIGGRRQAGQVERDAPQQPQCVGLLRGFQLFRFEARKHEAIERLAWPGFIVNNGDRHFVGQRLERPMIGHVCTFGDPAAKEFFMLGRECNLRVGRRHALLVVGAENTSNKVAFFGFTGDDHFRDESFARVQSQFGLARGGVGTVAVKAFVGKNRADVAIVRDGRLRGGRSDCRCERDEPREQNCRTCNHREMEPLRCDGLSWDGLQSVQESQRKGCAKVKYFRRGSCCR